VTKKAWNVCPACGNEIIDGTQAIVLSDRRKGLAGCWQLIECNFCGIISMIPMPTDEQLANYYTVYSKDEMVDLSQKIGSRHPKLRKLFHRLSGDVDPRDFVQVSKNLRVLDYGCGHATYLSDFHNRGIAISGAEIAEYVVQACQKKGLDVQKVEDVNQIPFANGEFDIVYLMQVFEHLRNPNEFMQELNRVLKTGGMLYIAVPNKKSIWRKVFGTNWVSGWFAPFHLFHYDRNTLVPIARRHGFEPIKVWSSTPESWFRLNLKAFLFPDENSLDWKPSWLDMRLVQYVIMVVLRGIELFVRERDCLVMKLEKRG